MQDPNTANQGDLIFKLDQDRAWLLENLDKGKWSEIRSELAALERKISKLIISVQENNETFENKETAKKSSWDSSPLVPEAVSYTHLTLPTKA